MPVKIERITLDEPVPRIVGLAVGMIGTSAVGWADPLILIGIVSGSRKAVETWIAGWLALGPSAPGSSERGQHGLPIEVDLDLAAHGGGTNGSKVFPGSRATAGKAIPGARRSGTSPRPGGRRRSGRSP